MFPAGFLEENFLQQELGNYNPLRSLFNNLHGRHLTTAMEAAGTAITKWHGYLIFQLTTTLLNDGIPGPNCCCNPRITCKANKRN